MTKRFIEETFPVKEISEQAAREKRIRQGYISNIHPWWARRPLASSRAAIFASLIPATTDDTDFQEKRQFIVELSKWENSLNTGLIEKAQQEVLLANKGEVPIVVDPFAGGGTIPLETLRLGCSTYARDLNPVAVLIELATIEFPQRYGRCNTKSKNLFGQAQGNPLHDDVKKWGRWVLDQVKNELEVFYPAENDGYTPVAFCWIRTLPCQNPNCGGQIFLKRNWWLYKGDSRRREKNSKKVVLIPQVDGKEIRFKIAGTGYGPIPEEFNPDACTVSKAVATCLLCGSTIDAKTTRRLFQKGENDQQMAVVVLQKPGKSSKKFRVATEHDVRVYKEAEDYLNDKRISLHNKWGIDPVPDEETPEGKGSGAERAFSIRNYGINIWGDLFNSRQKLELIVFIEYVKLAFQKMKDEGYEEDYAKAIVTYLALGVDKLADYGSMFCMLNPPEGRVVHTFGRQALSMVWDYAEASPFNEASAGWSTICEMNERWIQHAAEIATLSPITINQGSATSLPYPNDFFDAVFTDPPYYDNVPYSYLSDFFYVWLKRAIGYLYPELFSTPLTPKKNEIVMYGNGPGGLEQGKQSFELLLKKSFQEMYRVLKPDGIATIVYAHKSLEGWETLINSLIDSHLIVTSAWPIHTEMGGRLRSIESAALASSIYIVARKMRLETTGFYKDVKEDLTKHLNKKLERLWKENISGADFFIAAIGSAIEIFGKYEHVMDYEGNQIRADKLLDDVQHIATNYAMKQILHDGFGAGVSKLTRFYVLWRWNYGETKVHFDEARKLAQSCDLDLTREWGKNGFVLKEKEFIRIVGPQSRKVEHLSDSDELIDVLHYVLLLWEQSKHSEIVRTLSEKGYGTSDTFRQVVQAIAQTLPNESKEKKLLDGFLPSWSRLRQEIKEGTGQMKLSEY